MTMILTGCFNAASDSGLVVVIDPLIAPHAAALAGDDVAEMRATGRDLIATWDAALGRE